MFEIHHAIKEHHALELRTKQQPVNAIVLVPIRSGHRIDLRQQTTHVLPARGDRRGRVIRQLAVPCVQSGVAAGNGIVSVAPVVIISRDAAQRGR